jgi:hypothetical protein
MTEQKPIRHMDADAIDRELRRWLADGEPDEFDPCDPTTAMLRFLWGDGLFGGYVLLPMKRDAFTLTLYNPREPKETRAYASVQFTPRMLEDAAFGLVHYLLRERSRALAKQEAARDTAPAVSVSSASEAA